MVFLSQQSQQVGEKIIITACMLQEVPTRFDYWCSCVMLQRNAPLQLKVQLPSKEIVELTLSPK